MKLKEKLAVALAAFALAVGVQAAEKKAAPSRGELLYENHCNACHTNVVHTRATRRAKTAGEVETFVRRWANEISLNWSDEEVDAVVQYLVNRYYKFEPK